MNEHGRRPQLIAILWFCITTPSAFAAFPQIRV